MDGKNILRKQAVSTQDRAETPHPIGSAELQQTKAHPRDKQWFVDGG
jgi:hypothetical protein